MIILSSFVERDDTSNGLIFGNQPNMVPTSFCGCSSPIDRVAVISDQCFLQPGGCGVSRGKAGTVFNTTLTRCAGSAEGTIINIFVINNCYEIVIIVDHKHRDIHIDVSSLPAK